MIISWSLQMTPVPLSPAPQCSPLLTHSLHARSTLTNSGSGEMLLSFSEEYWRVSRQLADLYLCFELSSSKSWVYPGYPSPAADNRQHRAGGALCRGRPLLLSELWLAIIQILEPFINKAHNEAGMRALLSDITTDKFWFEKLGPMTRCVEQTQNANIREWE